jgi:hypothetical protein
VRLVLSLRAERVQTLLDRWAEHSDAPFLPHAECFAHFHDPRGRAVPYLPLRLFSADEAASAWPRAAASGSPACPAPWTELAPATRELLRHPLRMHLFHGAFADDANPPAIAAEEVLWDRWLDATFDPAHSSGWLESEAPLPGGRLHRPRRQRHPAGPSPPTAANAGPPTAATTLSASPPTSTHWNASPKPA